MGSLSAKESRFREAQMVRFPMVVQLSAMHGETYRNRCVNE